MVGVQKVIVTPEEYLELDRNAETKSEYIDGQIVAMAGTSLAHSYIVANLMRELGNRLRRGQCRAVGTDMRVQIEETGAYVFPDVVVFCGEPKLADNRMDVLQNPTVVFEVLSPSTEAIDRGRKFEHYRRLQSLTDYILVAQDRMMVEHFHRSGSLWVLSEVSAPEDSLNLESVGCAIPLVDIYEGVLASEEQPSDAA